MIVIVIIGIFLTIAADALVIFGLWITNIVNIFRGKYRGRVMFWAVVGIPLFPIGVILAGATLS